jgi:putative ABC transport system permease protein
MNSLLSDFSHALLSLRRRPGALIVPVLTMAIGIGASTAIFSALSVALFNPLPYPKPDQLVMGRATFSGEINPWASAPDFFDYREQSSVFQSLSAYRPEATRLTLRSGDRGDSALFTEVSWDLFRTLGVDPALGRHFTQAEGEAGGPLVAIISDGYWRRSLGAAKDVIGRTLDLRLGREPIALTIIGVMPRDFRFAYTADVWTCMQRNAPDTRIRRFHSWMILGRLKPGVSLAQAQKQVDAISAALEKEYPDSNRNKALLLTPLREALAENERPSLLILFAAVGLLLLAACADVGGLLLSRGAARQGELAIRSALGATRANLVRQLLAESAVVAIAAGALGLLVGFSLRGLVLRFVPLDSLGVTSLPIGFRVLLFAAGVTAAASALFGVLPALVATRVRASDELKAGTRTTETRGRALFRQGLVSTQVAMSVVLLVVALLLGRSLMQLQAIDPGFDTSNLLIAELHLAGDAYSDPAARNRFLGQMLEQFRAVPGVEAATVVNSVPILDPANNIPAWDADHPPAQPNDAPVVCVRGVLPGYFKAMGIPLVAGRDLTEADSAAADRPPVIVISQSVGRRLFGSANPLGKRMQLFTGSDEPMLAEVVGVVGNVRMNSLASDYSLAMYLPYIKAPQPIMKVLVRAAGDPPALARTLESRLARLDRGLVLADVKTMDRVIAESLSGFSLRAGALVLFGCAALLLAMLGVYGVIAFTVSRRRPDLALRMIVGASRVDIMRWVLARGLLPVAVGLVLGLAAAWAAGSWLRSLLFNVPPTDLTAYGVVTVSLLGAAMLACLLPAWRAMHLDPARALRAE